VLRPARAGLAQPMFCNPKRLLAPSSVSRHLLTSSIARLSDKHEQFTRWKQQSSAKRRSDFSLPRSHLGITNVLQSAPLGQSHIQNS